MRRALPLELSTASFLVRWQPEFTAPGKAAWRFVTFLRTGSDLLALPQGSHVTELVTSCDEDLLWHTTRRIWDVLEAAFRPLTKTPWSTAMDRAATRYAQSLQLLASEGQHNLVPDRHLLVSAGLLPEERIPTRRSRKPT